MSGRTLASVKISRCDAGAFYIPTPEEIQAKCKELQEGWNKTERHHRTVVHSDAPVEVVELVTTRPNARGPVLFNE